MALRAAHERGEKSAGIDLKSGRAVDMFKMGIVEPARIKRQTIKSATDVFELSPRCESEFVKSINRLEDLLGRL
jgi:chaperonin GroEL (HSP60 family)